MMQITYQKRNGKVFTRFRNTTPPYKIGQETSMGWIVLNIEYEYKNKFYPSYEYCRLIQRSKDRFMKKQRYKSYLKKHIISLLNILIGFIFYNLIIYK